MNQSHPTIYINKRDGSEAVVVASNIRGLFGRNLIAVRRLSGSGYTYIVGLNWFKKKYWAHPVKEVKDKKWSPLKIAERDVILRQLGLNSWNKNRTRKDLKITINTLNAKIIKYGLVKPL